MPKKRYYQRTYYLRNESKTKDTALAQYDWSKDFGLTPDIEWAILKTCKVMQPGDDLCINENVPCESNECSQLYQQAQRHRN